MICKAQRIDNGEEVEGGYFKEFKEHFIVPEQPLGNVQINPQTIKYSFNGGKSWYSEDEMQMMIRFAKKQGYKTNYDFMGAKQ